MTGHMNECLWLALDLWLTLPSSQVGKKSEGWRQWLSLLCTHCPSVVMTASGIRSFTCKVRESLMRKAIHALSRFLSASIMGTPALDFNQWKITVITMTKHLSEVFQGPCGWPFVLIIWHEEVCVCFLVWQEIAHLRHRSSCLQHSNIHLLYTSH